MTEIAVIDYGMGNVHSVSKALVKVSEKNTKVIITNSIDKIRNCSHIVFPGQGAALECMKNINKHLDIEEFTKVIHEKPFLGICMGLQVLMNSSDENNVTNCLDIFDGEVKSIKDNLQEKLKIPHMGWSQVTKNYNHPVWENIKNNSYFYFVHSFFVKPKNETEILSKTFYGFDFASGLSKENIVAVQFHPEKSSKDGLQFLQNFINWKI
jgi:glutamine amidotransferase